MDKKKRSAPDAEGNPNKKLKAENKEESEKDKEKEPEKEKTKEEILNGKLDEFLNNWPSSEEVTLDDPRKSEELIGLVKRNVVYMTREFEQVHLCEFDNISCTGAPVIISFPSIGLVGVLTGKQIVKTLKLPLIGVIKVQQLQVACVVSHEQPSHPGRIYGNASCVVFICEMALQIPPDAMQNLIQCIYDFANRHRSPNVYVLEGMPKPHRLKLPSGEEVEICINNGESDEGEEGEPPAVDMLVDDSVLTQLLIRERLKNKVATKTETTETAQPAPVPEEKPSKKPKKKRALSASAKEEEEDKNSRVAKLADKLFGDEIHYVTTNQDLARQLKSLGYIPVVDGIIPGVAGGLLAEAPLTTQLNVTVILAPTSTVFPDPDSAILVLKLLHSILPAIGLDKTAAELEKDVASLKKMMKGIMQNLTSGVALRKSGSVPLGMYQ